MLRQIIALGVSATVTVSALPAFSAAYRFVRVTADNRDRAVVECLSLVDPGESLDGVQDMGKSNGKRTWMCRIDTGK